jgi:hypothetical protein
LHLSALTPTPHRRPGEEGPFTLRLYASAPLEAEQLPAPFHLALTGAWSRAAAGGPRGCASWGSNPQYLVSCQRGAEVLLALRAPPNQHQLLASARAAAPSGAGGHDGSACGSARGLEPLSADGGLLPLVGGCGGASGGLPVLTVVRMEPGLSVLARRIAMVGKGDVVAEAAAAAGEAGEAPLAEAVVRVRLEPDVPYAVVPALGVAGARVGAKGGEASLN